jgi:hypothetical protein
MWGRGSSALLTYCSRTRTAAVGPTSPAPGQPKGTIPWRPARLVVEYGGSGHHDGGAVSQGGAEEEHA